MIPKKIHYCWFGRTELPQLAKDCIASWHQYMPDWEYCLWDENSLDGIIVPYIAEAYEAKKYAFVSDYVRLWALEREGGVYLDTDVELFKSLEDLLNYKAFAGFEGSKHLPLGTCVLASEAHGEWVREMLGYYDNRHFVKEDGSFDLTTNVQFLSAQMRDNGFIQNGAEQDYKDLHIFPVEYFCPRQTTGEYLRSGNTYCDHLGLNSWSEQGRGWKSKLERMLSPAAKTWLIKMKRRIIG